MNKKRYEKKINKLIVLPYVFAGVLIVVGLFMIVRENFSLGPIVLAGGISTIIRSIRQRRR